MGLRPQNLDSFIGQEHIKQLIRTAIIASQLRGDVLDHILLTGPSGVGKTTLAFIIANELDKKTHILNAAGIEHFDDVRRIITSMRRGDILFIDEIHRLPIKIEEFLYHPMEDSTIEIEQDIVIFPKEVQIKLNSLLLASDPRQHYAIENRFKKYSKTKRITTTQAIPSITFIGATTKAGGLTKPLRDRFNISVNLKTYTVDELALITSQKADMLNIQICNDATTNIARRSKGTARIVVNFVKRCRDTADVLGYDVITSEIVDITLEMLGIDPIGLNSVDLGYLEILARDGKPRGLRAISASLNEDIVTIEEAVEPYLIQIGFVERTPRGRMITKEGYNYVKDR